MQFLGISWHRPVPHFIHLFWVGRNSVSWQDVTQKDHTSLKEITFFGLIFKLRAFSQLNTNSVWSNMVLTSGAKIQMSSRCSSKVTNCWSLRQCSINLQKLDPTLDRPNGMWVNSYRPEEPDLNAVFLMLSSAMANCKYPCARLKEVKTLQLCTTCNASSMRGKGNASWMVMEFNLL